MNKRVLKFREIGLIYELRVNERRVERIAGHVVVLDCEGWETYLKVTGVGVNRWTTGRARFHLVTGKKESIVLLWTREILLDISIFFFYKARVPKMCITQYRCPEAMTF